MTIDSILFIIDKKRKKVKCLPTDEWISKMQSIHTYQSAIKRNEVLIHATVDYGRTLTILQ